jgi:DNA-binding transcriptional regulator GbsR (MarR family)
MTQFSDLIIEMLRASPNGLTSNDLAARLGTSAGNLSSRLSKLAAYGVIGKARRPLDRNDSRATVYQALSGDSSPSVLRRPGTMNRV